MTVRLLLKGLFSLSVLFSLFFFPSCIEDDDKEPVVTGDEGLYINEIYASGDDWIELFNNTAAPKDVSGYRIYDDVAAKYTFPGGTVVPANGFLIVYCDDGGFGVHASFRLTSAGETVYLESPTDVIDKVTFPPLDNGQSYARFPDGSANFAVTGNTTQGASNGASNAPAIASVTRNPLVVRKVDNVVVTANMVSVSGVNAVKLFYRANQTGSYSSLDMTLSGGTFVATIPALNQEGRIDYYVEATNASGMARNPNSAPEKTHYYILSDAPIPALAINELMAFNSACCPDTDGGSEEFDDWIEIRNNSASPIDIGGMYLSDDKTDPFRFRIPDGNPSLTTIPASGYIRLWADNGTDQGALHANFGLSTDGEDLGLYFFDGRTVDELSFGPQEENKSLARIPDGTGAFQVDATPTPDEANN